MFKVVFGLKALLNVEARPFYESKPENSVTTKCPDLMLLLVPPNQIPPVPVLFQQVWLNKICLVGVGRVAKLGIVNLNFLPCPNGLQEGARCWLPAA